MSMAIGPIKTRPVSCRLIVTVQCCLMGIARTQSYPVKETAMGYEGDELVSDLPMVEDVPLSVLSDDEDVAAAYQRDIGVPVAAFQSAM